MKCIALVFLHCTSQSSLVNQKMRLLLGCLFLGFSVDANVASGGGYRVMECRSFILCIVMFIQKRTKKTLLLKIEIASLPVRHRVFFSTKYLPDAEF